MSRSKAVRLTRYEEARLVTAIQVSVAIFVCAALPIPFLVIALPSIPWYYRRRRRLHAEARVIDRRLALRSRSIRPESPSSVSTTTSCR